MRATLEAGGKVVTLEVDESVRYFEYIQSAEWEKLFVCLSTDDVKTVCSDVRQEDN